MSDQIERAATILAKSKFTVALTGAGISVESGIPPFRGKGGLWERIDPMKYAHINALREDPGTVWRMLIKEMNMTLGKARPNPAHIGLMDLEELGILRSIITQNVDGLHQMAGSTDVIEFHGTFSWVRCFACDRRTRITDIDLTEIPPRCRCGGIYRPDAVFFGEMIPQEALFRSQRASGNCDVMLVIGTSALVQPSASIPFIAKDNGAAIIEINPEPTQLTDEISDISLMGPAGSVMPRLVRSVRSRMASR